MRGPGPAALGDGATRTDADEAIPRGGLHCARRRGRIHKGVNKDGNTNGAAPSCQQGRHVRSQLDPDSRRSNCRFLLYSPACTPVLHASAPDTAEIRRWNFSVLCSPSHLRFGSPRRVRDRGAGGWEGGARERMGIRHTRGSCHVRKDEPRAPNFSSSGETLSIGARVDPGVRQRLQRPRVSRAPTPEWTCVEKGGWRCYGG